MRSVLLLLLLFACALRSDATVFLAGDSTVAEYGKHRAPLNGWGQGLKKMALPGVEIRNYAVSGDSARYFRDQGRWKKLEKELKKGDFVLIQFGHNDQKKELPTHYAEAMTDYSAILQEFIDSCRRRGAEPILVTSLCRRYFSKSGKIWNSLGGYPEAMRRLAKKNAIALIDLNAISERKLSEIGDAASVSLFVHVPPGKYKAYPKGAKDNTHLSEKGAEVVADWIVSAMQKQGLAVGKLFRSGTTDLSEPVAGVIRLDLDGSASAIELGKAECGPGLRILYPAGRPEKSRRQYGIFSGTTELTDHFRPFFFRFTPNASGTVKFRIRGGYTKENTEWIAYDDFRVKGARLHNPDFEQLDRGCFAGWIQSMNNLRIGTGNAASGKNYAVAAHDHFLEQMLEVTAGQTVTVSFQARFEKHGPVVTPQTKVNRSIARPASYYRYANNRVKYLPLRDKGIPGDRIGRRKDGSAVPRIPQFTPRDPRPDAPGAFRRVPVHFLDENPEGGVRQITFGFPLEKGRFFDCRSMRLADPEGTEIPAGFTPIGFWPDGSVKFVEITFAGVFRKGEGRTCYVELGHARKKAAAVAYRENEAEIRIDTGRLRAVVDKRNFNVLKEIEADGRKIGSFAEKGLALLDEQENLLGSSDSAPRFCKVFRAGPEELIVSAAGTYPGNPASYEARIFFRRNSALVRFEFSFTDTNLKHEFTDYSAWRLDFLPDFPLKNLTLDGSPVAESVFQWSERDGIRDGRKQPFALTGRGRAAGEAGSIAFYLADTSARYPKGFERTDSALRFHLLPVQPGKEYGRDLPYYLMFPFCEGKYRLKWGMRFTETLSIDFSGESAPGEMPVGVIDRDYLASTGVFPGVPPRSCKTFDPLEERIGVALREHLALKRSRREYGFLNYGDWFGERGRNWGNNEYDLAHGLFQYFLRSGDRLAWKSALATARHQADVDIIHAYPDPYYVGANAQHSVGHTGVSYQPMDQATWSCRLDQSFSGENGHTWCDGMVEAGMLASDRRVLESALLLGEHLVNHTSCDLKALGSHERSAGWSMKALIALYRAGGEKRYLEAAARLARVALQSHSGAPDQAWPHLLPPDHANNVPNAAGNACFLIAVLMDGLHQYALESGDPAVRKVLVPAAGWLLNCWNDSAVGWPYTADAAGRAYWPAGPDLNMLIVPPLLNSVSDDRLSRAFEIASRVLDHAVFSGISRIGKELGYSLEYLPELYARILQLQSAGDKFRYVYRPSEVPRLLVPDCAAEQAFPKGVPSRLNAKWVTGRKLGRFVLEAPPGMREFTLRVTGVSGGRFHVQVTDPEGRVAGDFRGLNSSGTENGRDSRAGEIRIRIPAPWNRTRCYEVGFSASGNVAFALAEGEMGIRQEK